MTLLNHEPKQGGVERARRDPRDPRRLAIFDLDGTLTRRDTFLPFLLSFGLRYRRYLAIATLPIPVALYVLRLMSDSAAKQRLLVSFLSGQPMERIDEHAEWFCRKWVSRRLNPPVVDALRKHQHNGDRVILLSASPSVYVPAIARSLGVDEVICTQVKTSNGHCEGRLSGPNCKGAAKLQLLRDYVASATAVAGSSAYGDSRHDFPVLRWVDHGWLVQRGQLVRVSPPETSNR